MGHEGTFWGDGNFLYFGNGVILQMYTVDKTLEYTVEVGPFYCE